MNSPPESPSSVSAIATYRYENAAPESPSAHTPMPRDPRGTKPNSTLLPERRPASTLPSPMPMARKVPRNPLCRSSSPMTSLPKSRMSNCRSAPRNQKYAMPSAVSHNVWARQSRVRPRWISAHGLRWKLLVAPEAGTWGSARMAAVPPRALTIKISPMMPSWFFQAANIMPPSDVPRIIARKPLISNSPLARERS